MKLNKNIHDEDYDFSIKLMVPLLTILVCTICLCATTWAWYTASVSTGVNSITSGVSSNVKMNITQGDAIVNGDGSYTIKPNSTIELCLSVGTASNGYYALIDITDENSSYSISETLLNIFVNRVYAEEDNTIRKAIYLDQTKTVKISNKDTASQKNVSIRIVWADAVKDSNGNIVNHILNSNYSTYYTEITEDTINILSRTRIVTINYLDIDENPLPASVLGLDTYGLRDNLEEETAIIRFETEESEFTVTAPEGYLLQKDGNFNEETDVPYRTYQIEPVEEIEIDVICVKIEEEPALPDISEEENQEVDEVVEVPKETEPVEVIYAYTVNCIDTDSYTLINSFTGESLPGEITIDIPLIDGYVADSNTTVIKVTENTDANVFTVQYKKLYNYEIRYIDENNNILESVINQTSSNQVEVPLKQFDDKELLLLEGEKADTTVRLFDINKELETNVFEIRYQSIVQSENVEALSEEQISSD